MSCLAARVVKKLSFIMILYMKDHFVNPFLPVIISSQAADNAAFHSHAVLTIFLFFIKQQTATF